MHVRPSARLERMACTCTGVKRIEFNLGLSYGYGPWFGSLNDSAYARFGSSSVIVIWNGRSALAPSRNCTFCARWPIHSNNRQVSQ